MVKIDSISLIKFITSRYQISTPKYPSDLWLCHSLQSHWTQSSQPISWLIAKHPAFSTNHLADINNTSHNHNNDQERCKNLTNLARKQLTNAQTKAN